MPIIVFSDWRINALVYGGILCIYILYRYANRTSKTNQSSTSNPNSSQAKPDSKNNSSNPSKPNGLKRIENQLDLKTYITEKYYKGDTLIEFETSICLEVQTIMHMLASKKHFPFYNSYSCNITCTGFWRQVTIEITHSQGFRLFLALFDTDREQSLSDEEKIALKAARDIPRKILLPTMSSLEKANRIHDYLVSTSSYDYDNYVKKTIPKESYTPYGLLILHKAVCQAYAETYMLLMTIIGIECYMVQGDLVDSQSNDLDNHAWNIVKINGRYGHVDVTNDNPYPKRFGTPSQQYFFRSDSQFLHTHSWDIMEYPNCR